MQFSDADTRFAYRLQILKMEALNHQGITFGQVGHKSRDDVSDTEVVDGYKQVKIDIYFTGAGPVDLATVKEMLAIAEAAQNTTTTSHF